MITIKQYTLEAFVNDYLPSQKPRRGIKATFLHHTWKPRKQDYKGIQTIEGIRSYHVNTRGWSDIGANAYAAPDGTVFNGRPLSAANYCHAIRSRGWSDVPATYRDVANMTTVWPNFYGFGIETIGDFDAEDPTTSRAMSTALDVLAAVHKLYNIPAKYLFFHRDVANKSCPGKKVSYGWAQAELEKRLAGGGEQSKLVKLVEHKTGTVVAVVRVVPNGDHIADQSKLYIERPEWAE
jgi:hypothetical protein